MFYTLKTVEPIIKQIHTQKKQVVLVTGFFDLLHSEHQRFLTKASQKGDVLVVAVESDERARAVKGPGRPVQSQLIRCKHLHDFLSSVIIIRLSPDFNNPAAYEGLIATIRPHIYAVSSHTSHQSNKKSLVEKYGGKLEVVHDHNPQISTTKIISQKHV